MSRHRVLVLIESLGRGGAEQALVNLLPALKGIGVEVEVAALWAPYSLAQDLEDAGIPVHRLNLTHRWNLAQGLFRVLRLSRSGGFQVVHAHLFFAGLYAALTRPFLPRLRRVVTFHNLGYDSYPANTKWRKVRKKLDSWLMRHWINGYVAVSSAVALHYEQHLGLPRMFVLPNAFPVESLRPSPTLDRTEVLSQYGLSTDDFVLLFCGRLVHEKGHRFFLQALELLRDQALSPKAIIVGDGPLAAKILSDVQARSLQDQVQMHPAVPHQEVLRLIQASDLFVMASTHEGFPLAPAEAMALERAVLATRVGGLPDLVGHGVSGMLVPPGDPAALAESISRLMVNPELRQDLGRAARQRIERNFDSHSVAVRLEDYYVDLLTGGSPSGADVGGSHKDG